MSKIHIYITIVTLLLGISGNLYAQNDMLSKKQEKIVILSSLTARGELDKLKPELVAGLEAGLTVNEIKEALVHLYAYSGFPRSLRGLQTFMTVLDERKAAGIKENWGREASPVNDTRSKYERGKEILAELSGVTPPEGRATAGYAGFSPEIETFLKEHLFADLFERDVLTYEQREMVTVSVLMGIGGVEPMLNSHMNLSLNVGITPSQLRQMIQVIETHVSKENADAAKVVLDALLQKRGLSADTKAAEMINGVKVEKVSFPNRFGNRMAANLYFPPNYDAARKYAAIAVGHPFGGVKEQTSGLHAQKMAELGYVTLAFDATHYGESGGYPRYIESPETRVEDFSAAVDFLSNHTNVNPEAIGVIGICGGGGYSVSAAQIDHRIKAVATISMYDMGRAVSAYFSEDAYQKAAEPKELFVVPGASHVDLYDRPQYQAVSLPKLDSFFKQYLKQ